MEKEVIAAIVGAVGGLIAGGVAAWITIKAKRLDRVVEEVKLWVSTYDAKLVEQRLGDYRKLWTLSETTSRRRVSKLDLAAASTLAEALTDWYYQQGGMLMSGEARDGFFSARGSLESPFRNSSRDKWYAEVVEKFSGLRTALCEDINSRRGPTLGSGIDVPSG
jgi:hypothetical protein